MGMEMVSGRNFIQKGPSQENRTTEYILNETAIGRMGLESPIGKKFGDTSNMGTIIGVVKDFHFASLHKNVEPMVISANPGGTGVIFAGVNSQKIPEAVKHLESTWQEINPSIPFSFTFLDETIDRLYRTEHRLGKLFLYFTYITIFIACLGLFGLASYTAEQRTKEIGIRKVLGASVSGILLLLSKQFTKWIFLANIIAWPAAYFAMKKWLQNFAFQTHIGILSFFAAGVLVLVIALLAVSYQAVRAANANPVDALKYE